MVNQGVMWSFHMSTFHAQLFACVAVLNGQMRTGNRNPTLGIAWQALVSQLGWPYKPLVKVTPSAQGMVLYIAS